MKFDRRHLSTTTSHIHVCNTTSMRHASVNAQRRLSLFCSSIRSVRSYRTLRDMPSPKIKNISPLPADEAKWTELRKIEVYQSFTTLERKMLTLDLYSGSTRYVQVPPIEMRHTNTRTVWQGENLGSSGTQDSQIKRH
jgi:hypothetical protein